VTRYRVRVRGYDVQLLVYDDDRLIDTFHFVSWWEVLKWDVIR